MRFLASAAFIALLAGVAPAIAQVGPPPGPCTQVICPFPTTHVTVNGVESQSQLVKQLHEEGYTHIRMSDTIPNCNTPRPDLTMPTSDLEHTPVHKGWNGTAMMNGNLVSIFVD